MPNLIYKGKHFTVEAAILRNGSMPAKEFLDSLTDEARAKIEALFKRLADIGVIRNETMFKKLKGKGLDLFEFKSNAFQIRMLCYFTKGRLVILTNGFYKKRNETKKSEIERALQIKNEYEALKTRGY